MTTKQRKEYKSANYRRFADNQTRTAKLGVGFSCQTGSKPRPWMKKKEAS